MQMLLNFLSLLQRLTEKNILTVFRLNKLILMRVYDQLSVNHKVRLELTR